MIRRSLAAFAIAVALGLGVGAQVHAGGTLSARADIQVEISHPSVCDAMDIHKCGQQWMVDEISTYETNGVTRTSERVSFYSDLREVNFFINRLSQEFTLDISWHDVYSAFARTNKGTFACENEDDNAAIACAINLANSAHATIERVDVRWN